MPVCVFGGNLTSEVVSSDSGSTGDTSSADETGSTGDTSSAGRTGSTGDTSSAGKTGSAGDNGSTGGNVGAGGQSNGESSDGLDIKFVAGIACGSLLVIGLLAVLFLRLRYHDDNQDDDYDDLNEDMGIRKMGSESAVQGMPDPVRLQIEEIMGSFYGRGTVFTIDKELVVGSDRKCDIVFADNGVSPRHARIYRLDGRLFIEDLGSDAGTYLDGMRLFSNNPLRDGDAIGIGEAGFVVRL